MRIAAAITNIELRAHADVTENHQHPQLIEQINDIEDLLSFGRVHTACPFYLSRQLAHEAEMIFLPYNYLINQQIRETLKISLEDSVIILDEAHNLESVCTSECSFEMTTTHLRQCISAVDLCAKKLNSRANATIRVEDLNRLKCTCACAQRMHSHAFTCAQCIHSRARAYSAFTDSHCSIAVKLSQ
jgi:Rad3-related DNA helicase